MSSLEHSKQAFSEAVADLDKATVAAIAVSERNISVDHTGRQNRALFLLAKLIAHNMSALAITDCYRKSPPGNALLDHFSIASLGRTIIDASLMTMYLSHPTLTRDEWNLRRYVLYLHDLTNRKRFLTAAKTSDDAFFGSYPGQKARNLSKIDYFAHRLNYSDEMSSELKKGQRVYVDGARGAVREAGWDLEKFEFQQVYLSAFVHSHPVSFMRAEEHFVSFSDPSEFQLNFCAFVLGLATSYTQSVQERMGRFCETKASDPLGQVDD